jgi:hypothetical protein
MNKPFREAPDPTGWHHESVEEVQREGMAMSSSDFIRWGGLAGMVGGALWALTPLREPLLGGEFPGHPVFRPYNLFLLLVAVLLIAGLLALRARYRGSYGRLGTAGVVVVFVGYALLFLGSVPAVVLSAEGSRSLIMAGQDLGFLAALLAGVGAILLGIALLRGRSASRAGALLLIVALPVGFLGVIVVAALGLVDIAGLPLTVLYGGAWIVLGIHLGSPQSATTEQTPRVR